MIFEEMLRDERKEGRAEGNRISIPFRCIFISFFFNACSGKLHMVIFYKQGNSIRYIPLKILFPLYIHPSVFAL